MAQEVKLMGATYSDVPAILLPDSNNVMHRFDDCSVVTATASDVAQGKIFVASDGMITTGTSSGGGGSSAWTKVAETSYQVSTTSTSASTVATWATGHSEIWTSDKFVYVRIRDTEGKRKGYFYGTDTWFINMYPANSESVNNTANGILTEILAYSSSGLYKCRYGYTTSGYGVYADMFYNDGSIRIRSRYQSTYSLTIDGTYKVEVYLLDPPTGAPIFT